MQIKTGGEHTLAKNSDYLVKKPIRYRIKERKPVIQKREPETSLHYAGIRYKF